MLEFVKPTALSEIPTLKKIFRYATAYHSPSKNMLFDTHEISFGDNHNLTNCGEKGTSSLFQPVHWQKNFRTL